MLFSALTISEPCVGNTASKARIPLDSRLMKLEESNDIKAPYLTPPTIEIVGFLGGAARFIAKPCLKQRVMRFPTIRYGCSAQ